MCFVQKVKNGLQGESFYKNQILRDFSPGGKYIADGTLL